MVFLMRPSVCVCLCVLACFEMKLYRPCLNLNASLSTDSTIVKIITIQLSELSEAHEKNMQIYHTRTHTLSWEGTKYM